MYVKCSISRCPSVRETSVHLAVASGVFNDAFFPLDVLDEIWDLIESDSEGFLTYFFIFISRENFMLS